MEDYYKEMYSIAIDEHYIYYKCPFSKTNKIHKVLNPKTSLLNRDVVCKIDCVNCGDKVVISICDNTDRITLKQNKRMTSFSVDKPSSKRIRLLHNLEIEGKRQFNKTPKASA